MRQRQIGKAQGFVGARLQRVVEAVGPAEQQRDVAAARAEYSAARIPQLAVMAAGSPLLGILTVRFGARPILIASTALLGFAFAGVAGISSLWQLYALIMLQGLVVTRLGDISVGQVVARWATKSRGLALGIVYTGSNHGGSLLTRMAAWLADHESWRAAFAILGIGGVALMLPCAIWLVRDRPPRALAGPAAGAGKSAADAARDLDLRAALRTRSFWNVLVHGCGSQMHGKSQRAGKRCSTHG